MHQCFSSMFRINQDVDIVSIDGCPSGVALTAQDLLSALQRFFQSYNKEAAASLSLDKIKILEGVSDDVTTGQMIKLILQDCPNCDHAYVRQATGYVMAGAVARNYLGNDIRLRGALVQLGEHIVDRTEWSWSEVDNNALFSPNAKAATFWQHFLDQVGDAGQSVGAVIELQATGVPAGWTGGSCATLDGDIARALMSIKGAKGVEMGAGFALAAVTGTLCADQQEESTDGVIRFKTNNAGGVMNGHSTGQEIITRFAVQPTILKSGEDKPAHPCFGISAVPVGEALLACVLAGAKLQKEKGDTAKAS